MTTYEESRLDLGELRLHINAVKIPIDPRAGKGLLILFILALAAAFLSIGFTVLFLGIMVLQSAFFRDPRRQVPPGDVLVSPADGKVVEISDCFEDRFLGEEAVKVGIFLSVFNAHVNRTPLAGSVQYLKYEPGKFLNALNKDSVHKNESNWIGIAGGSRKGLVRQITGAIARRIYWDVRIGQELQKGEKLGIICYGSRTEFFAPKRLFKPSVRLGQNVKAGETVLGEWAE